MEPPPRLTGSNAGSGRVVNQAGQTVLNALNKMSGLTVIGAMLQGQRVLNAHPNLLAEMPAEISRLSRPIMHVVLGAEDLLFSSVTTTSLIKMNLQELGQVPLTKVSNYQCRLVLKTPGVLDYLSGENLIAIYRETLPVFAELVKPDDLPAKPFLALSSRKLAKAISYFVKRPQLFPSLLNRIFKQLPHPIPPVVFEALPYAFRRSVLEQELEPDGPCADWLIATLPFPKLRIIYRDSIRALHSQISVSEKDRILLPLQGALEKRSAAELHELLHASGFTIWCLAALPRGFIASLKLNELNYSNYDVGQGRFVSVSIATLFDPACRMPEILLLLQKLNQPQLMYLHHLGIITRESLERMLGSVPAAHFIGLYEHQKEKSLRDFCSRSCRMPHPFELVEVVLQDILAQQGHPGKYPSFIALLEEAGAFFPGSPQKLP